LDVSVSGGRTSQAFNLQWQANPAGHLPKMSS
jgi:hypothetical protein